MWYQNIRSALFSFVTIHASDGQTDGQTELQQQYRALHYMQSHGKNCTIEARLSDGGQMNKSLFYEKSLLYYHNANKTNTVFQSETDHLWMCLFQYDCVTSVLMWPWSNDFDIWHCPRYSKDVSTIWIPRKFLGQGFRKLQQEEKRHILTHIHRQTRPNALPTAFAAGKNKQKNNAHMYILKYDDAEILQKLYYKKRKERMFCHNFLHLVSVSVLLQWWHYC